MKSIVFYHFVICCW